MKGVDVMSYFETIDDYPNSNTVWNLYDLLPKNTNFYFEVINADDNRVLDSFEFRKENQMDEECRENQDWLNRILADFEENEYHAIKFQWNFKYGSNALIQVILTENKN